MENQPLFSVLISQYNNVSFLTNAIESVFAQTYENWEIIIVDDGSTDSSFELYKNFTSTKIQIHYNKVNKGIAFTKRRCIELANGKICGFLDPDDELLPNAIEIAVKNHIKYTDLALTFSRFYFINEKNEIISESRPLNIPPEKNYFTNLDYLPEHFATFKKEYYEKTEGISTKYKLGIDQDLYFKLEEVGSILIIDEFTYLYRLHQNSISSNVDRAIFWNLIIRFDTSIRRNLSPDEYALKSFQDYINHKINEQKIITSQREIENKKLKKSWEYKIGKILLFPFRMIKSK